MVAVRPVTYAEYYHIVKNDLQKGDPSAVYEYETPVYPVGGVRLTPTNIITAICGDSSLDA